MKTRRLNRGTTLVETLTAAFMTVLVLTGAVAVLLYGLSSWARGEGRIMAEGDAESAVRIVSQELRQAMLVSVDPNGLGLSYQLPLVDANGNYVAPPVPDGVTRRIELDSSTLNIVTAGVARPICGGVILTDPLSSGGTGTYRIFSSPGDAVNREVTVEVVTQRNAYNSMNVTSRDRETIYLRNVPVTTN
jgi:hypothetical protein